MLEVYFKEKAEVIWFCDCLFRDHKQIDLNWRTDRAWGNRLQFLAGDADGIAGGMIAGAMASVFIKFRLPMMVTDILREQYYYSNPHEMERIYELIHGMFHEEGMDRELALEAEEDPVSVIQNLFRESIRGKTEIHFDSIVKFRLPSIRQSLDPFVGLAIDEFKREENHQAFIETLREYIAKKKPRLQKVYVLQGQAFTFYKESGKPFTRMELRKMMQEEPLYLVGLHANEWNLAPLVAMAPEKIQIYGDDPAEPKTLTAINVFQEKAELLPLSAFPFYCGVMNRNVPTSKT